jgi:hypothetical protein
MIVRQNLPFVLGNTQNHVVTMKKFFNVKPCGKLLVGFKRLKIYLGCPQSSTGGQKRNRKNSKPAVITNVI